LTISNENSFEVSQIKNRSSNHKCSDKNMLTHPLRLSIGGSAGMLVSKVFVAEGTLYLAREWRNGIEGKVKEKEKKKETISVHHTRSSTDICYSICSQWLCYSFSSPNENIVTRYNVSCCSVHPQHRVRWNNKLVIWYFLQGQLIFEETAHTKRFVVKSERTKCFNFVTRD